MHLPLLQDIVITLGGAVFITLLFQKLKLPAIIGFLITGIIAGPSALSLINAREEVEMLAEVGVILLLFIIGLEFSLKSLAQIQKAVFAGGSLQVFLTILTTTGFMLILKYPISTAIFTGFLISLSSTAIGLKLLNERGETFSPHGRVSLAILIFQDIIVVPMMLFTPLIAGKTSNIGFELLILLGKGAFIIVFVILAARYLVPWLLFRASRTRSNEVFILTVVVICFSVAWLTSALGLSLALGAFLAGLTISESEYSHQATSAILPFREVFTSFFFISIGMLLDLEFVSRNLIILLPLTLLVFLVKAVIATGTGILLRYPVRTSILTGMVLFQVGEFAFILSETGRINNLMDSHLYQFFLAVSILTMAISPFLFRFSPAISMKLSGKKISPKIVRPETKPSLEDHIIIIGYGINGKNVARAARFVNIPYTIIELNSETVKEEKAKGEPIIYGDAMHGFILNHVAIEKARIVVIAISDPAATKRIIANVRELSRNVHIIVRTRFVNEIQDNFRLGANEVIPEEFETSIEIFTRVLHKYLVPENQINDIIWQIRAGNYEMLRPLSRMEWESREVQLPGLEISALHLNTSDRSIIELPLAKAELRKRFGVTVVGIKRRNQLMLGIDSTTELEKDDIVYVFGKHEDITQFTREIS
jgi:monovalent cation:H+ antiporter-2, CPA2 family